MTKETLRSEEKAKMHQTSDQLADCADKEVDVLHLLLVWPAKARRDIPAGTSQKIMWKEAF